MCRLLLTESRPTLDARVRSSVVSDLPVQASNLDTTEVDDGLVVFEPVSRRVHHLNVTATLVFELCTGDNDVAAISQLVQTAFGLPETPAVEVEGMIEKLRAEGLIV